MMMEREKIADGVDEYLREKQNYVMITTGKDCRGKNEKERGEN